MMRAGFTPMYGRPPHVLLAPFHHGGGPDGARILHPAGERDGEHENDRREWIAQGRRQQLAEDGTDKDRHKQGRDRQNRVAKPHQQVVDPAAEEACRQTD